VRPLLREPRPSRPCVTVCLAVGVSRCAVRAVSTAAAPSRTCVAVTSATSAPTARWRVTATDTATVPARRSATAASTATTSHRSDAPQTTRAVLANKTKATSIEIIARWPLENHLNVCWAQVLHTGIYVFYVTADDTSLAISNDMLQHSQTQRSRFAVIGYARIG